MVIAAAYMCVGGGSGVGVELTVLFPLVLAAVLPKVKNSRWDVAHHLLDFFPFPPFLLLSNCCSSTVPPPILPDHRLASPPLLQAEIVFVVVKVKINPHPSYQALVYCHKTTNCSFKEWQTGQPCLMVKWNGGGRATTNLPNLLYFCSY